PRAPVDPHIDIQASVAIEVPPDRVAGVDPFTQACLISDPGKSSITVVPKKFKITPLVEEQILVAVVVIIGAGRPGRDARARPIDISDSRLLRNLFEQLPTGLNKTSFF